MGSTDQWVDLTVNNVVTLKKGKYTFALTGNAKSKFGCGAGWGDLDIVVVPRFKGVAGYNQPDTQGGCPANRKANTDLIKKTITIGQNSIIKIQGHIIRTFSGRADAYLYYQGKTIFDRSLTYTNNKRWEDVKLHYVNLFAKGTHTFSIRSNRANAFGCGTSWGDLDILVLPQKFSAGGDKPALKCGPGSASNCKVSVISTPKYSAGNILRIHNGRRVRKSTETDSCPKGYKIWSPRNKNDWTVVYNAMKKSISNYPRKPHFIIDVTRPADGCGGCTKYAMKSTTAQQGSWRTTDRSAWWLRDARYNEPNGDYHANCYLHVYDVNPNNVRFNDGNCNYYSTEYLCQPNKGHRRRAEALPTLDLVRADRQMKELPNLEAINRSENFISSIPGVPMPSEVPQKEGDRGGLLKIGSTDESSLHNHG